MNKWKLLLACGALCVTSPFVFAGGPDMPPPGHSSIFIGVGGAYDYVQQKAAQYAPATPVNVAGFVEDNSSVFGLAPVGQIGYEYFFGSGGFFGVKGLFNFVDKNTQFGLVADNANVFNLVQTVIEFQSMVQAMLEGGVCINNNAFYLEGGYSALFTKVLSRNPIQGGFVQASQNQTLNGGVAGIGYRHYFWDTLFLDAVYSYSIYQDGTTFSYTDLASTSTTDSTQLNRVRVQDIVLSVNYSFNF